MACYAYKENLRGRTVTVCTSCSWWQIELLILLQGEFDKIEWIFHSQMTSHKDESEDVTPFNEGKFNNKSPGFPQLLSLCWTGTATAILVPVVFIFLWKQIRVLGRMCKEEPGRAEYEVEFESDSNPSVVHWPGSWVNTNKKLGILLLNLLFLPRVYLFVQSIRNHLILSKHSTRCLWVKASNEWFLSSLRRSCVDWRPSLSLYLSYHWSAYPPPAQEDIILQTSSWNDDDIYCGSRKRITTLWIWLWSQEYYSFVSKFLSLLAMWCWYSSVTF